MSRRGARTVTVVTSPAGERLTWEGPAPLRLQLAALDPFQGEGGLRAAWAATAGRAGRW